MSRNRTLWGAMLALLMVIGYSTTAFAQDAIDDAVAAVEEVTSDTADTQTAESDEPTDLIVASDVPSPVMVLQDEATEDEEWYDKITLDGNFRWREQWNYASGGAGTGNTYPGGGFNRYRMRFRLLLNLGADATDDIHLGIQLGSSATATSTNATYNGFGGNALNIRRAWATLEFADDMLRVTVGQFAIPETMYRSILTWDSDINITGIHLGVAVMEDKDDANKISQALYINALALYVLENTGGGANNDNPMIFAGSVDFRMADLRVGAGFWHMTHLDNAGTQFALKDQGGPSFAAFEIYAKYKFGGLSIFAHAIYNTGGSRGFGALGGVSFKDGKGEGAIKADLIYYFQERNAWPGGASDADAGPPSAIAGVFNGGMSGASGVEINAKYYIWAQVAVGIETNFYYLIEDATALADDNDFGVTFIFDIYFDF